MITLEVWFVRSGFTLLGVELSSKLVFKVIKRNTLSLLFVPRRKVIGT